MSITDSEHPLRIARKKATHKVNFKKPVIAKPIMEEDKEIHGQSCFTKLWDIESNACSICADNDICGVIFSQRLKGKVAQAEEEMGTPWDKTDFEGITYDSLLTWLRISPRTYKELVARVAEKSKSTDEETVTLFTKSFIKDNPILGVKGGTIYFKN